jgi:hypothetical protein
MDMLRKIPVYPVERLGSSILMNPVELNLPWLELPNIVGVLVQNNGP